MLRSLRSRRRPRYGAQVCAVISALLLLLSVSLLYNRLSSSSPSLPYHHLRHPRESVSTTDKEGSGGGAYSSITIHQHPLIGDSADDNSSSNDDAVDKIDELDTVEDDQNDADLGMNGIGGEEDGHAQGKNPISSSGYYVDLVTGSIRRGLSRKAIEEWDLDYGSFGVGTITEDKSKAAFGSDDVPIDEQVRRKVSEVEGVEDALLLKVGTRISPLREGWGDWFDKKGDFLRRDRMFKSNLEVLNPLSHALLQDPDGVGVTGLTRGDKAVQKMLLSEFKRTPFLVKKPLSFSEVVQEENNGERDLESRGEMKRMLSLSANRKEMNKDDGNKRVENLNGVTVKGGGEVRGIDGVEKGESTVQQQSKSEELNHLFADGKRWGYFPGLHPHLSFSDFMNSFFRKGKCDMRVFMVWNSPPWMYSVRHQRGLESLLLHHRDACVVMFSETIDLDFFKDTFVKDGYKVAVAMPNLDELLKDTPTHMFASVWFEWRKTMFYPIHYSELVRLAALYKYGGIYLDSDIIVLNPLSSLNNTVGQEDELGKSLLNGAVMAFGKHSPFVMECLKEFYMTYDDTYLRWNGADLLTRVARNFSNKEAKSSKHQELNVAPSNMFFPVSSKEITSYFTAPATEIEKATQDALFRKTIGESLTFHFWNGLTSTLIPEPESLVTRLIDRSCIRCFDML